MTANWPIPAVSLGPNHRDTRQTRVDLLQQFQPFPAQAVLELHKAGQIAARSRQTSDEIRADRIGNIHENDRHSASCLQHR